MSSSAIAAHADAGSKKQAVAMCCYGKFLSRHRIHSVLSTTRNPVAPDSLSGYKVTRYEHSLQSATHAYQNGENEEMIVAALLHDIGDELAPYTHGEMVAAIFKPYMSEKTCWIIKYHGLFQTYYSAHYFGEDGNARDKYKDHPYYQDCIDFCDQYDQNCFDPAFQSLPVEFFEPMVRRIFSQAPSFADGDM